MIIPEEILKANNALFNNYSRNDYIFYEDDPPLFYYQVINGSVKMCSFSTDGQEFIQGIFNAGQSFGEPAIFGNFPFPSSAIALEDCVVAKLQATVFLEILKKDFELIKKFTYLMAERLRYKSMVLKEISSYNPEHIIMTMLKYIRKNQKPETGNNFHIPYTRQQIADMTGLRVETVIRTIKRLAKEGKLEVTGHKIYLK
jgi:CRP-like cAMP-binding protein